MTLFDSSKSKVFLTVITIKLKVKKNKLRDVLPMPGQIYFGYQAKLVWCEVVLQQNCSTNLSTYRGKREIIDQQSSMGFKIWPLIYVVMMGDDFYVELENSKSKKLSCFQPGVAGGYK